MTIGLLTYHYSSNVGALLQTYATCRALTELGHIVFIIDLRLNEDNHNSIIKIIRKIILYKHERDLNYFRDSYYPQRTKYYGSVKDLQNDPPEADCYLVGSDQVWNPYIAEDRLDAFLLNFGSAATPRLSYASSIGLSKWPTDVKSSLIKVKESLSRFRAVSVRENTAKQLLANQFGISSTVVIDPTLLHRTYEEITGRIEMNGQMICYLLNRTTSQLKRTRQLAKSIKLKPRMISTYKYYRGFKYTYPPSVKQWIQLIAGASFVVTDSFHGLAFSLLYHKQFVVITPTNNRTSRIVDLLDSVGLRGRYFCDEDCLSVDAILSNPIDYSKVETLIDKLRINSYSFLENELY